MVVLQDYSTFLLKLKHQIQHHLKQSLVASVWNFHTMNNNLSKIKTKVLSDWETRAQKLTRLQVMKLCFWWWFSRADCRSILFRLWPNCFQSLAKFFRKRRRSMLRNMLRNWCIILNQLTFIIIRDTPWIPLCNKKKNISKTYHFCQQSMLKTSRGDYWNQICLLHL